MEGQRPKRFVYSRTMTAPAGSRFAPAVHLELVYIHAMDFPGDRPAALGHYDVLGPPGAAFFERLAHLAAFLLETPMAGIHFIDDGREWAVAQVGFGAGRVGAEVAFCSFCAHAVDAKDLLVVEDASEDPRFLDRPAVTGDPAIRFYAGTVIRTPTGDAFGRLCVMDTAPRPAGLSELECEVLRQLAGMVMDELQYRARPRHLDRVLDSLPNALCALDTEWCFTYVNQQAEALLGRSREDLLGQRLWDQFPETKELVFYDACHQAIETGTRIELEEYFPPLAKWLRVHAYPMREGLSVCLSDVTVSREQRDRLKLMNQAIENTAEAILITEGAPIDASGPRIEYVNPAFERMTGYTAEEVIGRTPRILQGPQTDPDVLAMVRGHLERGESVPETTTVNYRKDGTPYWVEWSIAPVYAPDGTVAHWVAAQRDVTERVRHERKLAEAKEAAEQADRLKSTFLDNMSHEFRTPLTSIIGYVELLQSMVDEDGRDMLRAIHKNSRRLEKTLTAVLDIAQLEEAAFNFEAKRIDLQAALRDVASGFEQQAAAKGLDLRVEGPDESVPVTLDAGALRRVLTHLIDNAIKFTEQGHVVVRLRSREGEVAIDIADTGVGIAAIHRDRIFGAFTQESEGYSRKYEGTGLGLDITQRLVTLLGGQIAVESEKGVGSTFTVTLPRTSASS